MSWVCIDFGTCNTAAAIEIDGAPHIVGYGNQQYFPTVACVLDDRSIEVCQNAEPLRLTRPETFQQEFKLRIADYLDIESVTYGDIVAEILSFVKGCAEMENNDRPIDSVVLTIPAIYTENDKRKTVMLESARKAGFLNVEFMSEPAAAALHYAEISGKENVGLSLIYDLGGGTFDPALLEVSARGSALLGQDSGVKCGGHYFDRAIYNHIASQAKEAGKPLDRTKKIDDYAACRRLKEALSIKQSASQFFSDGSKHTLTRDELDSLIRPMIDLTLQACDNLLATAGRKWSEVGQVLLVGGSTAIPLVSEMLSKHTLSHNAPGVSIVRNTKGAGGEYNHRFATCLGGIAGKILPPPPPPEQPGCVVVDGRSLQLRVGDNRFGRGDDMDFRFPDPHMSRCHFVIKVSRGDDGALQYEVETKSRSAATVINNLEALDLQYAPISRTSARLLDGFTITAGRTKFIFKKS